MHSLKSITDMPVLLFCDRFSPIGTTREFLDDFGGNKFSKLAHSDINRENENVSIIFRFRFDFRTPTRTQPEI